MWHQLRRAALRCAGMVKRVRGVAHSMRVSPQNTNRMVDGARGVLNQVRACVMLRMPRATGRSSVGPDTSAGVRAVGRGVCKNGGVRSVGASLLQAERLPCTTARLQ